MLFREWLSYVSTSFIGTKLNIMSLLDSYLENLIGSINLLPCDAAGNVTGDKVVNVTYATRPGNAGTFVDGDFPNTSCSKNSWNLPTEWNAVAMPKTIYALLRKYRRSKQQYIVSLFGANSL